MPEPDLNLEVSAAGVSVSWGADAIGWELQKTVDLKVWLNVDGEIVGAGTYTQALSDPAMYFRLARP